MLIPSFNVVVDSLNTPSSNFPVEEMITLQMRLMRKKTEGSQLDRSRRELVRGIAAGAAAPALPSVATVLSPVSISDSFYDPWIEIRSDHLRHNAAAMLQPYDRNRPSGEAFRLTGGVTGEAYFHLGDGIRFFVTPGDDGHLYLVNESVERDSSQFNILFPSPRVNDKSSFVRGGAQAVTDECIFDTKIGIEKVWILWSARPVDQLEQAIQLWVNAKDQGEIKDSPQKDFLRKLLDEKGTVNLRVDQDDKNEHLTLRADGDVLIHPLKLIHR